MAQSTTPPTDGDQSQHRDRDPYRACLIPPMGRNGDPTIQLEHVVDAALVGAVTFAAILLGDVLPAILAGESVYLTTEQILARAPTAAVASLLAFAVQWARARGLDVLDAFPLGK